MVRLDHIALPVFDWRASRDWYRDRLGFEVEFENDGGQLAAMRDSADLTVFLYQGDVAPCPGVSFALQVSDVEALHRDLVAAGIAFMHPPQKTFWGYGAELLDLNGYCLRLWDQKSMQEKGGA